jgi:hypothetical protein
VRHGVAGVEEFVRGGLRVGLEPRPHLEASWFVVRWKVEVHRSRVCPIPALGADAGLSCRG